MIQEEDKLNGVSTDPAFSEEPMDVESLQDEQDIYENEDDITKLKKQIKTRKIVAGVFFALSVICLVARLIAL